MGLAATSSRYNLLFKWFAGYPLFAVVQITPPPLDLGQLHLIWVGSQEIKTQLPWLGWVF
jgi:hypothetical protein